MKRRDFIKSSLVLSAMGSRIPLMAINRTQKQMARSNVSLSTPLKDTPDF
jgi:hypothetical protein